MPKLHEYEEFQVWMRTAGLPTFSKLALKNEAKDMKAGKYEIKIYYRFPVREYSGTKSIVISTSTVMGGRNPFLGIAYCVVGGLCIVLGVLFTARHLIKPRYVDVLFYSFYAELTLTRSENSATTLTSLGTTMSPTLRRPQDARSDWADGLRVVGWELDVRWLVLFNGCSGFFVVCFLLMIQEKPWSLAGELRERGYIRIISCIKYTIYVICPMLIRLEGPRGFVHATSWSDQPHELIAHGQSLDSRSVLILAYIK